MRPTGIGSSSVFAPQTCVFAVRGARRLAGRMLVVAASVLALLPLPRTHLTRPLHLLTNQPAAWPCSAAKPAARCRILCCDDEPDEDPWLMLGVSYSATDAQIRRAFRHQARRLHPDVCADPDAPERFRSLVAAFKKLQTDQSRARWRTQSRAAYDQRVRGSAKERAARAWGAPDRPRGRASKPSTSAWHPGAARSATGVRKSAAERAAQKWREVEDRARAQAQTATRPRPPPPPPSPPPPPPPQQQQQQQQQQAAGSWPHQSSASTAEPPPLATPVGTLLCEVLLVELRDVRDRTRHHTERAAWRRGRWSSGRACAVVRPLLPSAAPLGCPGGSASLLAHSWAPPYRPTA